MRWKLLITLPPLAALVGAGATLCVLYFVGTPLRGLVARPRLLSLVPLTFGLAAATYAGIFVYRHTARRRVLQAFVTVLLSIALVCAALYLASRIRG